MPASPKRIASFRGVLRLWREDFATHGSRIVEPGFHAIAVYRFGVWVDGLRWALVRFPLRLAYLMLRVMLELAYGVRLQHQSHIGRRVHLAHAGSGIIIAGSAAIGDDCLLRQNVTLGTLNRKVPGAPHLGNRVEVGANAVIVGPVTIGDDVIIGPNTVVRRDVPPNTTVMPPEPALVPRKRPSPGPARPQEDAGRAADAAPGRGTEPDAMM